MIDLCGSLDGCRRHLALGEPYCAPCSAAWKANYPLRALSALPIPPSPAKAKELAQIKVTP